MFSPLGLRKCTRKINFWSKQTWSRWIHYYVSLNSKPNGISVWSEEWTSGWQTPQKISPPPTLSGCCQGILAPEAGISLGAGYQLLGQEAAAYPQESPVAADLLPDYPCRPVRRKEKQLTGKSKFITSISIHRSHWAFPMEQVLLSIWLRTSVP